jgi:Tfp pilus assembly protein PilN
MINLLSPALKEQIQYSRRNRVALHYLRLVIITLIVLSASFASSIYFINVLAASTSAGTIDKEKTIHSYDQKLTAAQDAAKRLASIKQITAKQTHFYLILQELGAAMPSGVAMDGISLTADATLPVSISVTGPTYESILTFKDNLSKSNIIESVNLVNVGTSDTNYRSGLTMKFKNLGQSQ